MRAFPQALTCSSTDPPKSASGISFKSQFLYLSVYVTRYLDLFWTDPSKSLWNTVLKIVFISAQFYIVYLMLTEYKPTHDPNQDTFKVEYLVGGAFVLAILLPYRYTMAEVRETTVEAEEKPDAEGTRVAVA